MIIEFISTWIPREISYQGKEYVFQLFINHPHYDIRICYECSDEDAEPSFLFLFENIDSDEMLIGCLQELGAILKKKGLLTGDYASVDGYSIEKFNDFMKRK